MEMNKQCWEINRFILFKRGECRMKKWRKHIRNLHDGTENGERLFDAIVEGGKVTIELKNSKKQLVRVPWEDIVTQVEATKHSDLAR